MKRQSVGFTIVELLIVIVVIAILVAITIVVYNGIQVRTKISQVSSSLTQAKKKLELYKVENNNYPTAGNLADAGITNNAVMYQYSSISMGATYCLTATVDTVSYNISSSSSLAEGACMGHTPGSGSLATNLMSSPSFEGSGPGWYSYWSNYVGGFISQATGQGVVIGNSAAEVSVTSSNQSGVRYVVAPALSANTTYTFSVYITPISGDLSNIGINIGDGAGTRANNNFTTSLVLGQTVRKTVTWTSSAGPGTTQIAVFRMAPGSGSAIFQLDAAMLELGSSATPYNG